MKAFPPGAILSRPLLQERYKMKNNLATQLQTASGATRRSVQNSKCED